MRSPAGHFHYRIATPDDISALHELIAISVRSLQARDYSEAQREGALGTWLGVDTQLIADGTYFIVEAPWNPTGPHGEMELAACGGWSRRKTLFGADRRPGREDMLLDPQTDAAKIRAFFVHPAWARRGIGTRLLEMCEEAARAEGFTRFEMGATLTGIPLYRLHGYHELGRIELPLENGEVQQIVKMAKEDDSLPECGIL
jgi:GNAT superfamily N-acetyltransferase